MRRAPGSVSLGSHLRRSLSPPAWSLPARRRGRGVTRGGTPAPAPSPLDPLRFSAAGGGGARAPFSGAQRPSRGEGWQRGSRIPDSRARRAPGGRSPGAGSQTHAGETLRERGAMWPGHGSTRRAKGAGSTSGSGVKAPQGVLWVSVGWAHGVGSHRSGHVAHACAAHRCIARPHAAHTRVRRTRAAHTKTPTSRAGGAARLAGLCTAQPARARAAGTAHGHAPTLRVLHTPPWAARTHMSCARAPCRPCTYTHVCSHADTAHI